MLTVLEPAGGNPPVPRGLLAIGGASIARHQLALVLALGCQRVICIANEFGPGILALQHEAERKGAQFHLISGARQLSSLVTAHDELLVLADGLLASPVEAVALLEKEPGVLVQPIESGLAGGFERIDLNHAAAGAMRLPGSLVERLSDLPPDCDVASALIRIALQAGIRQRALPAGLREGAAWQLVRDEAEAHATELSWIRLHMGRGREPSPGGWLARFAVRRFGPTLLHAGSGSSAVILGAGVCLLLALAAGWLGLCATGFVLLALAWLARRTGALLATVERDSLQLPPSLFPREAWFGMLADAVIVALAVWEDAAPVASSLLDRAFPPLVLIGFLRLLPRALPDIAGRIARDRFLLCMGLAMTVPGGALPFAIKVLALLVAAGGLVAPTLQARLTRP